MKKMSKKDEERVRKNKEIRITFDFFELAVSFKYYNIPSQSEKKDIPKEPRRWIYISCDSKEDLEKTKKVIKSIGYKAHPVKSLKVDLKIDLDSN